MPVITRSQAKQSQASVQLNVAEKPVAPPVAPLVAPLPPLVVPPVAPVIESPAYEFYVYETNSYGPSFEKVLSNPISVSKYIDQMNSVMRDRLVNLPEHMVYNPETQMELELWFRCTMYSVTNCVEKLAKDKAMLNKEQYRGKEPYDSLVYTLYFRNMQLVTQSFLLVANNVIEIYKANIRFRNFVVTVFAKIVQFETEESCSKHWLEPQTLLHRMVFNEFKLVLNKTKQIIMPIILNEM